LFQKRNRIAGPRPDPSHRVTGGTADGKFGIAQGFTMDDSASAAAGPMAPAFEIFARIDGSESRRPAASTGTPVRPAGRPVPGFRHFLATSFDVVASN